MTLSLSFWLGVACFSLFAGGLVIRTIVVLQLPRSKFPIGGAWAFVDSLCPLGLFFMDLWLYQVGQGFGWTSVLGISMLYSYFAVVRQRKRAADSAGGVCRG